MSEDHTNQPARQPDDNQVTTQPLSNSVSQPDLANDKVTGPIQASEQEVRIGQFAQSNPVQKSRAKRIWRTLIIVLVIGIAIALILGALLYFALGEGITHLASACTNRTNHIQSAADNLESQLKNVRVNGSLPTSVTNEADKDCVDGSGDVSATATYPLAAQNATEANKLLLANFHVQPTTQNQSFKPADNLSDEIDYVETSIAVNSHTTYHADYYIQTPVTCQVGSCDTSQTALQTYNLLSQPITKITLNLHDVAN